MNKTTKLILTSLVFLIVSLSLIESAVCSLGVPITYQGKVFDENNNQVFQNLDIISKIGYLQSEGSVSGGEYEIDVFACYWESSKPIVFSINGIYAKDPPTYHGVGDWGKTIEQDLYFEGDLSTSTSTCGNGILEPSELCDGNLFFSGLTCSTFGLDSGNLLCNSCVVNIMNCSNTLFCGDGACNNGETCSTCASDCGACVTTTSSGGGGGGGGGSSSSSSTPIVLTPVEDEKEDFEIENLSLGNQDIVPVTGSAIGMSRVKVGMGIAFAVLILALGGVLIFNGRRKQKVEIQDKE
jgi:hypothetical protein